MVVEEFRLFWRHKEIIILIDHVCCATISNLKPIGEIASVNSLDLLYLVGGDWRQDGLRFCERLVQRAVDDRTTPRRCTRGRFASGGKTVIIWVNRWLLDFSDLGTRAGWVGNPARNCVGSPEFIQNRLLEGLLLLVGVYCWRLALHREYR